MKCPHESSLSGRFVPTSDNSASSKACSTEAGVESDESICSALPRLICPKCEVVGTAEGRAAIARGSPQGLFAMPRFGLSRLGYENRLLAFLLRVTDEVYRAVDSPNYPDSNCHQRFLDATKSFDGSDDVEGHAAKVRDRTEDRYPHVLDAAEFVMLAEGHDGNDVGQSVQRESAEV